DWRDNQERRAQKVTFSLRTECNLSTDRHGRMYAVASRGPGCHAGVFRWVTSMSDSLEVEVLYPA
ncbi:hypothetical protein, partial [Bradyrhizobium ottawaense]|uniref:hypothetical protein n=1 Tax=Bradyrhizobium ottawaense TaxID=931866 RepID=UPI0030C69ACF